MSNSKRAMVRKAIKEKSEKLIKSLKRKKRDYIVRIHVENLKNVAILRVSATSRKEAVEATKAAIEITGEVAPSEIPETPVVEQEEKVE